MRKLGERFRQTLSGPSNTNPNALLGESFILFRDANGENPYHQSAHKYFVKDVLGTSPQHTVAKRCVDWVNPGPPYPDSPMSLIKTAVTDSTVQGVGHYHNLEWGYYSNYIGGFILTNPGNFGGNLPPLSNYARRGTFTAEDTALFSDLSARGPGAYNSMRPKAEKASIAVALAESRDFMPMMRGTSRAFSNTWGRIQREVAQGRRHSRIQHPDIRRASAEAAGNFLNVQFGWKPFIKDLDQFFDVVDNSIKYMAQVRRMNNTWIKRARTLVKQVTAETVGVHHDWPVFPADITLLYLVNGSSDYASTTQLTHVVEHHVWATGTFKYYRPEFDASLTNHFGAYMTARRLLSVYGANVNPSVIYKATPWTWLVDWCSNVGNSIENATAMGNDALVSSSFCLMEHRIDRHDINVVLNLNPRPATMTWSRITEIKHRQLGSPFGFDLSWDNFDPRKLAILSALGISRRKR